MSESSNTDCALSVTGPYESTAIVTGPMPRKPKATRPKPNTGAICTRPEETINTFNPMVLTMKAMLIRATMLMPSQ